MFEAQYLITDDEAGKSVYSPWMLRGGDQIRYILDLVEATNATIEVDLFHKNTEDTGDGTPTGSSIGPTSTLGRTPAEFATGLKEMVRYKFTASKTAGSVGWVLFRMLPPVWFDAVRA